MNTPGHNVAPDGNPWPSQLPPSSSRPANEEGAAAPTPYAKVNLAAREIARAAEKFQGNYQLTFDAAQAIIARFAPPSATNQSTVEALRTSLVECVAYLDRMGQDGVRERAYKALAMPVDSPHPQQPSAGQGADPTSLLTSAERLHLAISVMLKDWKDGDFVLPRLAEIHMEAVREKYLEVGQALAFGEKSFREFQAMLSAPIPPPPSTTGEPLFKKRLAEEHAVSLDPEWGAGAKAYAVILPSPGIIIIGDDDGEVQLYRRRAAHLFKALSAMPENQATGEPPAKEGEMQSDYPTILANWRAENVSLQEQLNAAKAELAEAIKHVDRREHGSTGWEWREEITKLLVALGIKDCGWHESFTLGWGGPFEFIAGTFRERDTLRARLAQLEASADEGKKDRLYIQCLEDCCGSETLAEARKLFDLHSAAMPPSPAAGKEKEKNL